MSLAFASAASEGQSGLLRDCQRIIARFETPGTAVILKLPIVQNGETTVSSASAQTESGRSVATRAIQPACYMEGRESSASNSHGHGTTGQIEGRADRLVRGAGRACVSRHATLSCAIRGAHLRHRADDHSACGVAGAPGERGADHVCRLSGSGMCRKTGPCGIFSRCRVRKTVEKKTSTTEGTEAQSTRRNANGAAASVEAVFMPSESRQRSAFRRRRAARWIASFVSPRSSD